MIAAKGLTLAAIVALPCSVYAQDNSDEGGARLDLTIGQSLVVSDNLDFPNSGGAGGVGGLSTFDLAYSDITRRDRFTFDLSGSLEQGGDRSRTLDSALSYSRLGANAQLDVTLSYGVIDLDDIASTAFEVDDSDPLNPVVTDVDVTLDNGQRSILGADLAYAAGLQSKVQLEVALGYRDTTYTDVIDTDLDDNTRLNLSAQATFQIDPRISLIASATRLQRDFEDVTDTTRLETSYGIGATFAVSPRTTASASVSFDTIETRETTGNSVTDGIGLAVGFQWEMPNGSASFDLTHDIGVNGDINRLTFGRDLTLANAAELSASIGLLDVQGEDLRPTVGVSYDQDFRRFQTRFDFDQSLSLNADDESILRTGLSARYIRPLSDVSALTVAADGRDSTVLGAQGEDRRSLSLSATYAAQLRNFDSWNIGLTARRVDVQEDGVDSREDRYGISFGYQRALTQDWALTSGLRLDRIETDTSAASSAATLSLGIERSFSWRP